MDGSMDAGRDEKVAGVVEQVRADVHARDSEDAERLLRQRFDEAGIPVSEEEFARHLDAVRGGPSTQ